MIEPKCLVTAYALVALSGGAAGASFAQVASPLTLERVGVPDSFGPGLVALSEGQVEFRLTRPAHVALLWVDPAGAVQLYYPLRSADRSARRAGRHAISVAEVPSPIESPVMTGAPSSSQPGRFPGAASGMLAARPNDEEKISGYWVLVATDVPITAREVRGRLAPMAHEGGARAVLERLPPLLVAGATLWAVYVAPVAMR